MMTGNWIHQPTLTQINTHLHHLGRSIVRVTWDRWELAIRFADGSKLVYEVSWHPGGGIEWELFKPVGPRWVARIGKDTCDPCRANHDRIVAADEIECPAPHCLNDVCRCELVAEGDPQLW